MKKLPAGFASPLILIAAGLIVGIGITFAYFQFKSKPAPQPEPTSTQTTNQSNPTSKVSPTASPDEAANWKMYTSADDKYSFKYPPDWQIYNGGGLISVTCSKCSKYNNVDFFYFSPPTSETIEQYINYLKTISVTDYQKIKLNGQDAVKAAYSGSAQAGGSVLKVFVIYKVQGYRIEYRFPGLLEKANLSQFPSPNPDILSTFKFK